MPRYIFTERSVPIPLSALMSVAGTIDPETAAPDPGVPLPEKAFTEVQGVLSVPPLLDDPLAEQEFGPSALPPALARRSPAWSARKPSRDGGITTGTGIVSYDGPAARGRPDGHGAPVRHGGRALDAARGRVAKSELAAFPPLSPARRKAGDWRDFTFAHVDPMTAHRLNDAGRLAVRKDAAK